METKEHGICGSCKCEIIHFGGSPSDPYCPCCTERRSQPIPYEISMTTYRLQAIDPNRRGYVFLVLTKSQGMKRGEYAEEFDVDARTEATARKLVEQELKCGYEPGLRVARIVYRGKV